MDQLFRPQARHPNSTKWFGSILVIRPLSATIFSLGGAAFILALGLLTVFGTYTRRVTVDGRLVPDQGVIGVYAPYTAMVSGRLVGEDEDVTAGQTMFVLSVERHTKAGDANELASAQIAKRDHNLAQELELSRIREDKERRALEQRIKNLFNELAQLRTLVDEKQIRVAAIRERVAQVETLSVQGYVTKDQLLAKREEYLEQVEELGVLRRDIVRAEREVGEAQASLDLLPVEYRIRQSELQRLIASGTQEALETEAGRAVVVTAPATGSVVSVMAHVGQIVDATAPLGSIVPSGSRLQAHLFVTSKAIGFVDVGNRVRLRYQAFPYQRFGQFGGTIVKVSRTATPLRQLLGISLSSGVEAQELVYRVTVELDSQSVNVAGRSQPLTAGTELEADLFQERRRIVEWLVEPMRGIRERVSLSIGKQG